MRRTSLKVVAFRFATAAAAGLALVLQLGLLPACLCAGPTTQPSADHREDETETIKASFVDLANSDPGIRSQALGKLMCLKADALPALKKVVEQSKPLLPAQASVLRQIVTQVFLSGEAYESDPRYGFLGIRMDQIAHQVSFRDASPENDHSGTSDIVIVDRIPGFAAAPALLDGDVILAILDRPNAPVHEVEEFKVIVKDMGAGATVNFRVLRYGQIIRVAVKLDPRPLDADRGMVEMDDLLVRRQKRANEYWATEFALLVKEGVS